MTNNTQKGFLETQSRIYGKLYLRKKRWHKVVSLLCAITVFITTYAMILPAITLGNDDLSLYSCGLQEHEHTDACYKRTLICGQTENTLLAWERTLPTELPEAVGDRILKVAESQVGYKENAENTEYNEALDKNIGYTIYGDWNGTPYADNWNTVFAMYCLHYAGVDFADMPINASAEMMMGEFDKANMFEIAAEHGVKAGDLIFIAAEKAETEESETEDAEKPAENEEIESKPVVATVGVVGELILDESGAIAEILVITGDVDNAVNKIRYSATDEKIIGYATIPEPEEADVEEEKTNETVEAPENTEDPENTEAPVNTEEPSNTETPSSSPTPEETKNIIISDPPRIGGDSENEHIHDDSCYEKELICGIPEHNHVDLCLYDLTGTRETQAEWEATIPELNVSWAENAVTVARSQLGYTESKDDYRETDGVRRGITRYGIWYGDPYADWDAMFAAFAVSYAGVPTSKLVRHSDAAKWAELLDRDGKYISTYFDDTFEPMPGDLVFFDFDADESKGADYYLEPKGSDAAEEDNKNEIQLSESGKELLDEIQEINKEDLTDLEKDILDLTGQNDQSGANSDVQCAENLARIDGVGVIAEVTRDENGNIVSITVIEGNKDDEVKESVYESGDLRIAGYAALPENDQSVPTDLDYTVDGEIAPKAAMKFGRSLKAPTRAGNNDTDIIINGLKVTLRTGAVQNAQGDWVKTPSNSYADQRYTFRVSYAMSGTYDYEPGQIEFRIPASILRDRAGQPSDAFEISLLFEGDPAVSASTVFVYRIDTDANELVIYNRIGCPAGQNGFIEIAYLTTKKTYEYADYGTSNVVTPDGASDPFYANLSITQNETTKTAQSDRIPVYMDTSAKIYSIDKGVPSFYEGWRSEWGNAPADHGQWCYLVWEIRTVITGTTQPYDFVLNDTPLNRDFEVVGYKMAGASGYSAMNRDENLKTDYGYGRYDYVLTRHKKSTYHSEIASENTLSFFTLTNRIKGTVIPKDNGQPAATSATAEKSWKFEQRNFDKPKGHFYAEKYGLVPKTPNRLHPKETPVTDSEAHISSYLLDDFRDAGTGATISDLIYFARTYGYPFSWTIPKGKEEELENAIWETWQDDLTLMPSVLSQYYRKETVTFCLDDKDFYLGKVVGHDSQLNSYGEAKINKAYLDNPTNGNIKLGAGEYRIDTLKLYFGAKDYVYDPTMNKWIDVDESQTDYGYYKTDHPQHETVQVYVYRHGTSGRVRVATLNLVTGSITVNDSSVVDRVNENDRILYFKPSANVSGYYIETTNSHYYSELGAFPSVTLFKTGNVETFVNSLNPQQQLKIRLANYSTHWINEDRNGPNSTQMGGPNQVPGVQFERIGFDYIAGIVPKGELSKNVVAVRNSVADTSSTVLWRVDAAETYTQYLGKRAYINQKSGVFFDLLPAGSTLDLDSVKVYADGVELRPGEYTVETSIDRATGRILLTIRMNRSADEYSAIYATNHAWSDIKLYGDTMLNSVAYETGNQKIGDGGPDIGYSSNTNIPRIAEWALMANLDPASHSNIDPTTGRPYARFLYAESSYQIGASVSVSLGLDKKVRAQTDSRYSYATTTYTSNEYSYALNYSTHAFSKAKDIVLFDSIENYITPAGLASEWHGILTGWNTSVAEALGCKPVVYLSENSFSNFSAMESTTELTGDFDLTSSAWVRSDLYTGDLKNVKSVAFDLRKKANGEDFILDEEGSVTVYLYMRAPNTALVGADKIWAYNNVWLHNTQINSDTGISETKNIHQDYTRIGYVLANELIINKFDRTNGGAVSGTTFRLWGTSFDGSEIDRILTTGDNGTVKFENIPCGSYTLMEVDTTPEYLEDHTPVYVTVGADGRFSFSMTGTLASNQAAGERPYTLTNGDTVLHVVPDPAGVPLTRFSVTLSGETTLDIGNAPRVHGDLSFKKIGMVDGELENIVLPGVQFKLSGVSDYGTDVLIYATSDSSGIVYFSNIEKGRYKLEEVATVAHYFIPNYTWTVVCDENGNVTMTGTAALETDGGSYTVINEPLHKFKLRKVDETNRTMPVVGAVFRVYGTSDSGRPVDQSVASSVNGVIEFELESGTYILQETQAPQGYKLDSTRRMVTVLADGTVTVEGLEKITAAESVYFNYWRATNERNPEGLLNIRKVWNNDDPGGRLNPVIHVSSAEPELPERTATISPKKWAPGETATGTIYYAPDNPNDGTIKKQLMNDETVGFVVANPSTHPQYYNKNVLPAAAYVNGTEEQKALHRIDDENEPGEIWWWYDDATKEVWLWSNADVIYLPENSMRLFSKLGAGLTTLDLSRLHPGKINSMSGMFSTGTLTSIDFTGWADKMTGSLGSMNEMFMGQSKLGAVHLNNWKVGNVTTMESIFKSCNSLTTVETANWDVSKVIRFNGAFGGCSSLTGLNLSHWSPVSAKEMSGMFQSTTNLTALNLSGWNLSNIEKMDSMFAGCTQLANLDLSGWQTGGSLIDTAEMFSNCGQLRSLDLNGLDVTNVTSSEYMFFYCENLATLNISSWTPKKLIYISNMFANCKALTELDVANWDVSNVTGTKRSSMSVVYKNFAVFYNCHALTSLNLDNWKFTNKFVDTASCMFQGCNKLGTIGTDAGKDLFTGALASSWEYMFDGCNELQKVDCRDWYAVKVTKTDGMFSSTHDLEIVGPLRWQTDSLTSCLKMFSGWGERKYESTARDLNLSGWNTSKLKDMSQAFNVGGRISEIYLRGWQTNALTTAGVSNAFNSAQHLSMGSPTWRIYVSNAWGQPTSNITAQAEVFASCHGLTGGSDTVFNSSWRSGVYARVDGGASARGYFTLNNNFTTNQQTLKIHNSANGTNSANASAQGRYSFAAVADRLSGAGQPTVAPPNAALPNAAQPLRAPAKSGGTVAIEYVTNDKNSGTSGDGNADIYDQWYPDSSDSNLWWYRMHIFDNYEQSAFPLTFYVWEDPLPLYESDTDIFNYMKVVYDKAPDGTVTVTVYRQDGNDINGDVVWVEAPNGLQITNTKESTNKYGFLVRKFVSEQGARDDDFDRAFKFKIELAYDDYPQWIYNQFVAEYGYDYERYFDEFIERNGYENYMWLSPYTSINGTYGDVEFTNGEAIVYLKHQEVLTVTGLRWDTFYKITELNGDDYLVSEFMVMMPGDSSMSTTSPYYRVDTAHIVRTVTNRRDVAKLVVAKEVTPPEGETLTELDLQRQFTVNVTFYAAYDDSDPSACVVASASTTPALPDGIYGDLLIRGGKGTAYLRHGEEAEITGVPYGLFYVVEEETYDGYTVEYFGKTGQLKSGPSQLALVTNKKNNEQEHPKGGFTLRKQVADYTTDEDFIFHIDLTGLDANLLYGYTHTDASGAETAGSFTSATDGTAHVIIPLKDGESVRFEGLPATEYEYDANDPTLITGVIREGAKYTVSEERSGFVASYTVVDNNNTGIIASGNGGNTGANEELATANETVDAGEDIVITFTNTRRRFEIPFAKVDDRGNLLADAHLQIQTLEGEVVKDFITDDDFMTVALPAGSYKLVEVDPPEGYLKADPVEFFISEKGVVTARNAQSELETVFIVSMTDLPIEIVIHKKDDDVDHPRYVNGATLQLFEYGKIAENGVFIYDSLSNRVPMFTWITVEEGKTLSGQFTLNTVYRLHEADAPKGYELAEDILFVIGEDGSIIPVTLDVYDESTAQIDPEILHGTGTAPASALRNALIPQNITVGAADAQGTLELFRNSHASGLTYLGQADGQGKAFHLTPSETAVDPGAIDETYFSGKNMVFREEYGGGVYTYYVVNFGDSEHFATEAQYAEKLVVKHSATFAGASGNELTMTDIAQEQYRLPEAGGSGTHLFTILGLLILFSGAGCMIYRNKRRKEVIREG